MKVNYRHQKISLLTKHGKEKIIAPIIEQNLGCEVELVSSFDTDELGTFDRLTHRHGTQLETVRRKAHIGIDRSRNNIGIASEGSFVPDPFSGFMPWNIEMVIFVDDLNAIEVVGITQGSAMSMHQYVRDIDQLMAFAETAGFPSHHLVMRPNGEHDAQIIKGLSNIEDLKHAFIQTQSVSIKGKVLVENDLRAFCNPTRQRMIAQAAEDLVQKLKSVCPKCELPGYWKTKTEPGLPCGTCGNPTQKPVCEIWTCRHCDFESHQVINQHKTAEPVECGVCNP